PTDAAQILVDLTAANQIEVLVSGVVPIQVLICNARQLTRSLPEGEVFRLAAERLADRVNRQAIGPVAIDKDPVDRPGPRVKDPCIIAVAMVAAASVGALAAAHGGHGTGTESAGGSTTPFLPAPPCTGTPTSASPLSPAP